MASDDKEAVEDFDQATYEPEPTNHFDDSVNDMSKTFALGGLALGIIFALKKMYEHGFFS